MEKKGGESCPLPKKRRGTKNLTCEKAVLHSFLPQCLESVLSLLLDPAHGPAVVEGVSKPPLSLSAHNQVQ